MSITDERRQVVSFTDKYYSNLVRFVAGGARIKLYDTQESLLQNSGVSIAKQ